MEKYYINVNGIKCLLPHIATEKTFYAVEELKKEIYNAFDKFPPFNTPHEGYAIIKEELDELWEEVRKQYDVRTKENMRKEAKQIAAMALRFMVDLCE